MTTDNPSSNTKPNDIRNTKAHAPSSLISMILNMMSGETFFVTHYIEYDVFNHLNDTSNPTEIDYV